MDKLSDGRSSCIAFKNETYPSFALELKLESQTVCEMFGLFGYTGLPTKGKYDIRVRTQGINKVLFKSPYDLPLTFEDQLVQITIYNTKYKKKGYLDPLVITLKCEGKTFLFCETPLPYKDSNESIVELKINY